jgi:nucleotide-binding universal stress UspA family protein
MMRPARAANLIWSKSTTRGAPRIVRKEAPMGYRSILLHLDGDSGPRREQRLAVAIALAIAQDAHLTALFALGNSIPSYAMVEGGETLRRQMALRFAESASAAETDFRAATARAGLASAEWRASSRDALAAVNESARYADLVLLAQPGGEAGESSGLAAGFQEQVLMSCGRPVLFVPWAGRFDETGQRVLVAWDAGREATRAVTDALPVLRAAGRVDVVVVDPPGNGRHGEIPGADVALYLARHGVNTSAATLNGGGVDVGNSLLSRALDLGSDLIVMGAYGHSRLRELVLGGTTRTILESMTVPVLMSH